MNEASIYFCFSLSALFSLQIDAVQTSGALSVMCGQRYRSCMGFFVSEWVYFKPSASPHQLYCDLCVLPPPRVELFPIINCDYSDSALCGHVLMSAAEAFIFFLFFMSHLWQRCIWRGTVSPHCVCSEPHTHNDLHLAAGWKGWWSPGPSCWKVSGRRSGHQVCRHRGAHSCSPAPEACPPHSARLGG